MSWFACALHTSDGALAGVAAGRGADPVGRGGDVVAAILDHDGVASRAVGDVGHPVRAVAVVVDTGLLGFTILVLTEERDQGRLEPRRCDGPVELRWVRQWCGFTDGDEHAQLALARVLCVDVELHGEAGRDAAGQARTAGSHFTGVVSRKNPELEGAAEMRVRTGVTERLEPGLLLHGY